MRNDRNPKPSPAIPAACALLALAVVFCGVAAPAWGGPREGQVKIYLFLEEGGVPDGEIVAEVEGGPAASMEDGMISLRLKQGNYKVTLKRAGEVVGVISVPVTAGEATEAMVTLSRKAPVSHVEIEGREPAPALPATAPPPMTGLAAGQLKGTVTDVEKGTPVAGARVLVRGLQAEARTDAQGQFSLELPSGVHALSVIHTEYATQTVDSVEIYPGEVMALNVEVTPSSQELEAFSVTAVQIEGGLASLIQERQLDSDIVDLIGAEQMAKAGDSNAAEGLKRVTALTIVDGKYVYVRGMGERYSSSLLNGLTLPSTEPERRVVPLDLFPVDVIDSISVKKTYSPDLPGEFGGGTILIRTRTSPSELQGKLEVSMGYQEYTSFEQHQQYHGGSLDWIGVDDGIRSLPGIIDSASNYKQINRSNFSDPELTGFTLSLPNTWNTDAELVPPDYGFSSSVGNTYELWGRPVGFLFAVTYDNSYNFIDSFFQDYSLSGGKLLEKSSFEFNDLYNNIDLGTMLDVGVDIADNHSLQLTSLLIRSTENLTRAYWGYLDDDSVETRVTRFQWIEDMLFSQQVRGEHLFPDLEDLGFDWAYAFSLATRYEPDRRDLRYDLDTGSGRYQLTNRPSGKRRFYSDLTDNNHDLSLDFSMPFQVWMDLQAEVQAGGRMTLRSRDQEARRFTYNFYGTDRNILYLSPSAIFSPATIGPDGFMISEDTLATDSYDASQQVFAGYVMAEIPVVETLSVNGGVRVEYSKESVSTFNIHDPEDQIDSLLENTDPLPAVTVTWRFLENMLVRGAFSQTVNRPDFRELSPQVYNDVEGAREFVGNPDLKRALIQNIDLRWEWYPSAAETFSVAFFYKDFEDPIEYVINPGANQQIMPDNAAGAQNLGVEVEARQDFSFLHDALKDLYAYVNFSYIDSKVNVGAELIEKTKTTSLNRPLQGQSDYVVNATLGYDNPDTGTSLTLLYNLFGERIAFVGSHGLPDIYEQPYNDLDFVVSQVVWDGLSLKFEAGNLINEEVQFLQGGEPYTTFKVGRDYSLTATWRF